MKKRRRKRPKWKNISGVRLVRKVKLIFKHKKYENTQLNHKLTDKMKNLTKKCSLAVRASF